MLAIVGDFLFDFAALAAMLVLAALGLAIVFGMMGVINLAHGAFLTLGAYATIEAVQRGVNIWIAILIAGAIVGAFGAVVERLIIRPLYGRLIDTLLATWGLSLIVIQVLQLTYGTSTTGLDIPLGSFTIGEYSESQYFVVLIAAAAVLILAVYLVLLRTPYGIRARATSQIPEMARAMGINAGRTNMWTFAMGSALAGLGGGLLTPVLGISPTMGDSYVAQAFMVVVMGGAGFLIGTPIAAGILAFVNQLVTAVTTPFLGEGALLLAAIFALRFLPNGISGRRGRT